MHRSPAHRQTPPEATARAEATEGASPTRPGDTGTTTQEGHMASQTTTAPSAHAAAREAAIKAYATEQTAREAATGRGDKKGALSHGAKAANRSREIREAELEMAMAGETFTPWEKPHTAKSRQTKMSQTEIEEKIATLETLAHETAMETVKESAKQRIEALKKAAAARGYTL